MGVESRTDFVLFGVWSHTRPHCDASLVCAELVYLQRLHVAEHGIDLFFREIISYRHHVRIKIQTSGVEFRTNFAKAIERRLQPPLAKFVPLGYILRRDRIR